MVSSPVPAPANMAEHLQVQGSFPTTNTDLAACLGALRIPIQKWERIREADSAQTTTWHIFGACDETGDITAAGMDWAWRNREEFARNFPQHPMSAMRDAIEALQFIVRVHYGRLRFTSKAVPPGDFFTTDDWNLAACLKACGHQIADIENRVVKFLLLRSDAVLKKLLADYAGYEARKTGIQWMRVALEVRATLIEKTKPGNGLRTQVHYVNGDPLNGGKECFIFEDAPEAQKRILLAEFRK